jgi:hypothetical protein
VAWTGIEAMAAIQAMLTMLPADAAIRVPNVVRDTYRSVDLHRAFPNLHRKLRRRQSILEHRRGDH